MVRSKAVPTRYGGRHNKGGHGDADKVVKRRVVITETKRPRAGDPAPRDPGAVTRNAKRVRLDLKRKRLGGSRVGDWRGLPRYRVKSERDSPMDTPRSNLFLEYNPMEYDEPGFVGASFSRATPNGDFGRCARVRYSGHLGRFRSVHTAFALRGYV